MFNYNEIFRSIPYYYDNGIGYLDQSNEKVFQFQNPNSLF